MLWFDFSPPKKSLVTLLIVSSVLFLGSLVAVGKCQVEGDKREGMFIVMSFLMLATTVFTAMYYSKNKDGEILMLSENEVIVPPIWPQKLLQIPYSEITIVDPVDRSGTRYVAIHHSGGVKRLNFEWFDNKETAVLFLMKLRHLAQTGQETAGVT